MNDRKLRIYKYIKKSFCEDDFDRLKELQPNKLEEFKYPKSFQKKKNLLDDFMASQKDPDESESSESFDEERIIETYEEFLACQKEEVMNVSEGEESVLLTFISHISSDIIDLCDKECMSEMSASGLILKNGRFILFNER